MIKYSGWGLLCGGLIHAECTVFLRSVNLPQRNTSSDNLEIALLVKLEGLAHVAILPNSDILALLRKLASHDRLQSQLQGFSDRPLQARKLGELILGCITISPCNPLSILQPSYMRARSSVASNIPSGKVIRLFPVRKLSVKNIIT